MKACGISLYRTALSVVLCRWPSAASCSASQQQILAKANRKADVLDAQIRNPRSRASSTPPTAIGWSGADGSIYHYGYYNPERDEMHGPRDLPAERGGLDALDGHLRDERHLERRMAGLVWLDAGLHRHPLGVDAVRQPRPSSTSKRPTTSRRSSRSPT